jgi:broad specificity phosphatase PhoE
VPDPRLTILGKEQARALAENHPELKSLEPGKSLIVSSPFRRAIQTTLIALEGPIKAGVPVVILPQVGTLHFHFALRNTI